MSHAVNIKTQFKNISSLLNQFTKAGWKIEENTVCNTYHSDPRRQELHRYVAKNPVNGGFDVGIDVDNEGNAFFVCDFYDRSIEQQLGDKLKNIKQGYSMDELKKFLHEEDMSYRVEELATGELVVIAEN
jgi:hypothetical protein